MCGIIGYVGDREAKPLLLQGLKRLEYRGYDSAGIALREDASLDYVRAVGNLQNLVDAAGPNGSSSHHGLGHTRWATHGGVTELNAHPLTGCDAAKIAIVLNGIVENYRELKRELVDQGHTFTSETDAEVVVHMLEREYDGDLAAALVRVYPQLEGHFSIVAIHHDHPDLLVGVRHQTPLVVGVGAGEMFIASSVAAFLSETRRVNFLDDGEIVEITPAGARFFVDGVEIENHPIEEIDWDDDVAEKGGYETFMLKEIYEQPEALRETIGDRVRGHELVLEGLGMTELEIQNLRRVVVVACGTAYHAGVVGRYVIEEWARVPVEPDIASEWIYRNPVLSKDTLVIGISQSGETRDTVNAVKLAQEMGAHTMAITNLMGTQITREVDSTIYTRCGLEVGVAASKTFTAQVGLMYLIAMKLAQIRKTLPPDEIEFILDQVHTLPDKMSAFLNGQPSDRRDRAALLRQALLPLPRPPHRPARRPRGRAEAEGDLVHPDRRVLGGGDEARADRAARRGHAGGRRRHRPEADLREGRLEHPGDAGARRACDRDRDRRQRGHPAPRGRRDLHPAHAGVPAGRARRRAAAAARLPHRPPARAERRPAAQPRQDRHRRIAP